MGCEFYSGKKQSGKITQLQRQTIFVKKKERSHRIEPRVENNGQRINSLGLRVSHQETFLALRIDKPGNMYLDFRISWADDCCVFYPFLNVKVYYFVQFHHYMLC